MIAGGAAYSYWALKSPVPIRAREPEKGSTGARPEPIRADGISPCLIDSPDFPASARIGAGAVFFCGPWGSLFWRLQLALEPAPRPLGFEGIEPVAFGAFEAAQPVAISRHR